MQETIAERQSTPRRLLPAAVLVLVALFSLLPGLYAIPAVDRDEARFAQATRQMLESGDFVTPRLGGETRFKKPIGIYWLQAGTILLTGQDAAAPIGTFRLPSAAAALLAVLLTYAIGLRLFGQRAAFIGALFLAVSPIFGAEARLAKTDSVQFLAALAGQYALMRAYLAASDAPRRLGTALLFWGAMGAAILVKGPVVPMLAGLTVLALVLMDRKAAWLRRLRPAVGVPFMLLIVLPWFAAIAAQSGMDFFRESVGNDLLGKVATGQESHGQPPGTHLLTAFLTYWPGAFVALAAVPWVWKRRGEAAVRFCLAWLVPFWIAFELIVTKLPHYTLPAVPAAFLLAGAAVSAGVSAWGTGWRRIVLSLAAVIGMALAVALPVAFRVYQGEWPPLFALLPGVVAVVAGALAIHRLFAADVPAALGLTIAGAAMVEGLFFGMLLPRAERFWIAPRAAAAVQRLDVCAGPGIMAAGMGEASMLFSLGSGLKFGGGADAADFLLAPGCRIVFLSTRLRPAFDERLRALGADAPPVLDTVSGFNPGSGKTVSLEVFATSGDGGQKLRK